MPASLGGAAAPRIYSHVILPGTSYPAIVYQMQAAGDDLTIVNGHRVWADLVYVVKVVGKVTAWDGDVDTIAAWADAALHNGSGHAPGTYSAGLVYDCTRERPFVYVETDGDTQYRHLGGFYRLHVR